jgi:hypothetical protein
LDQYGTDRKPASEFKNYPSQEPNATIKRTLETYRQPLFRAPFLAARLPASAFSRASRLMVCHSRTLCLRYREQRNPAPGTIPLAAPQYQSQKFSRKIVQ